MVVGEMLELVLFRTEAHECGGGVIVPANDTRRRHLPVGRDHVPHELQQSVVALVTPIRRGSDCDAHESRAVQRGSRCRSQMRCNILWRLTLDHDHGFGDAFLGRQRKRCRRPGHGMRDSR